MVGQDESWRMIWRIVTLSYDFYGKIWIYSHYSIITCRAFPHRLYPMRNISTLRVSSFLGLLSLCQQLSASPIPLPPTLNVSTDLAQLPTGYNMPNMLPNAPGQDSAPLLNDAIQYVVYYNKKNPQTPYTEIVAQSGAYYFVAATALNSSTQSPLAYVVVDSLQNVTIELAGSSLFFANGLNRAFNVTNCQNFALRNFSVDYQTLPFTELRVTKIKRDANQILTVPLRAFPTEPPYVDVYELGKTQSTAALYGFDFRFGRLNPRTTRWTISPLSEPSNTLTLNSVDHIREGDIFEVEARGGGPAIWVQSSSEIRLEQLSIYSSGGVGIITNYCPFTSLEEVKIIPRPNTNRLVSTNAGGIAVNSTAQDNIIRNCTISGTQDDCISGNAPAVGYVDSIQPPSTCVLAEPNQQVVSVGCKVYFVDPFTGGRLVDPAGQPIVCKIAQLQYSPTTKTLAVTMTTALPTLPEQTMVYSTDTTTRGQGLVIDSNDISSNTLARGIALSGQTGVAVINNTLTRIQEAGILFGSNYTPNPKQTGTYSTFGPVSNILIRHNELHETNIGLNSIGITMLAAIQILTENIESSPASTEADDDILILDNKIETTPRTGIWVMNIGSGEISNNEIEFSGYDPRLPVSHIPASFGVTSSDFTQSLVIQSSSVKIGINPH
jgi:hypothetical protein